METTHGQARLSQSLKFIMVNSEHRKMEALWQSVDKCPACGDSDIKFRQNLTNTSYLFGKELIPFPDKGISVVQCYSCALAYKTVVPSASYLSKLFNKHSDNIWSDRCDFQSEKALIESLVATSSFDLLDVGPAHGALLKVFRDTEGRRAGLDIVQHTGMSTYLRGEFIQGLLEEPTLVWDNKPYDIVTVFDVFEHLYHPNLAFSNLRLLVKKDGFIVLETGDVCSFWPKKFGVNEWWYVNLLEHHLFWSEHSLHALACQQGFEVIRFIRKRHKSRAYLPLLNTVVATLKSSLYYLSPNNYKRLIKTLGKSNSQPFCLFTRDHFQAVLKKR